MHSQTKLNVALLASIALVGVAGAQIHSRLTDVAGNESPARAHVAQHQTQRTQRDWGVEVFRETFGVRTDAALEVTMEDADIIVESTTGSTIEVSVYVDADEEFAMELFRDMDFDVALHNNTVRVEAHDAERGFATWDDHADVVTVVSVPRSMDIDVRTGGGDILAGEFEGAVALRSADGDILLDAALGGELEVHTSDGDIIVGRIEAASARVRTGDGDVLLSLVDAPLSVSSGDGDVQVSLVGAHETGVATGDGDVTLFVPEGLSAEFVIDAEDVDLSSAFEVLGSLRRGVFRGALNGGGPTIEVRTGDGTVAIRPGR